MTKEILRVNDDERDTRASYFNSFPLYAEYIYIYIYHLKVTSRSLSFFFFSSSTTNGHQSPTLSV